jgi:hypothetical protein
MMLEDTNKYLKDVVGTSVENSLYFISIVILGIVGKHCRKNIGGCLERPKKTSSVLKMVMF